MYIYIHNYIYTYYMYTSIKKSLKMLFKNQQSPKGPQSDRLTLSATAIWWQHS